MEEVVAQLAAISAQLSRMEARVEELGAELQAIRMAALAAAPFSTMSSAVLAALHPTPTAPPPVLVYYSPEPAQR